MLAPANAAGFNHPMADDTDTSLAAAYALETPEDNRRLYAKWADTYDRDFAESHAYVYPQRIAALLSDLGAEGPLLDIGCGTGLVGEATAIRPVDGVDISAERLATANGKGAYRNLSEADLTRTLPMPDGAYRALTSTGTFTEGHVGPEALEELIRVAAPGAIFVLGVNETVFEKLGFPAALSSFAVSGAITAPRYETGAVYADDAEHAKADNKFTAAIFKRR